MLEEHDNGALEFAMHRIEDAAGGISGRVGAAMTERAEDFVQSAAVGDMYEIKSSWLALERASSDDVRDLARRMIAEHTESSARLEALLPDELREAVPSELDRRRQMMLRHLRESRPENFDRTYLDQQRIAHQESVTLMHHFRDNGDNPVLREFAAEISPIIESHLEHITAMAS
jgi:putative membrane protein